MFFITTLIYLFYLFIYIQCLTRVTQLVKYTNPTRGSLTAHGIAVCTHSSLCTYTVAAIATQAFQEPLCVSQAA